MYRSLPKVYTERTTVAKAHSVWFFYHMPSQPDKQRFLAGSLFESFGPAALTKCQTIEKKNLDICVKASKLAQGRKLLSVRWTIIIGHVIFLTLSQDDALC